MTDRDMLWLTFRNLSVASGWIENGDNKEVNKIIAMTHDAIAEHFGVEFECDEDGNTTECDFVIAFRENVRVKTKKDFPELGLPRGSKGVITSQEKGIYYGKEFYHWLVDFGGIYEFNEFYMNEGDLEFDYD